MSYESHIGKQIALDGCIFTIKKMGMTTYQCARQCFTEEELAGEYDCPFCEIPIVKGKFTAFELILNVVATNKADENGWYVWDEDIQLVDDRGFAHNGHVLCTDMPYVLRANAHRYIKRRTQANLVYYFPDLNGQGVIQALQFTHNDSGGEARLELERISEGEDIFSEEAYEKLLGGPDKPGTPGTPPPKDEAGRIIEQIEAEEQAEIILAKAHFLQKLAGRERVADESIRQKLNKEILIRIKDFENEIDAEYDEAPAVIQSAYDEFQRVVDNLKEGKQPTPPTPVRKEPEPDSSELCYRILQSQGYTEIRRSAPPAEGLLSFTATRYGWPTLIIYRQDTSTVDVPDIQTLAGHMKQTNTHRGVFITAGKFTRAAEFKAMAEGIDLVDGERIRSLGI